MKIGIISDSHDRIENLNKAIEISKEEGVESLIHCGDLCAPFMIKELSKFSGNIDVISGNICDEHLTEKFSNDNSNVNFHGDSAELDLGGRKIVVVHNPQIAKSLAKSGDYDAVLYGHDHTKNFETLGNKDKESNTKTILANPGEIAGVKNPPSMAIYDTEKPFEEAIKFYALQENN